MKKILQLAISIGRSIPTLLARKFPVPGRGSHSTWHFGHFGVEINPKHYFQEVFCRQTKLHTLDRLTMLTSTIHALSLSPPSVNPIRDLLPCLFPFRGLARRNNVLLFNFLYCSFSPLHGYPQGATAFMTNFETDKSPSELAQLYKKGGLAGGHVIMLGADVARQFAALEALHTYPDGMQIGGEMKAYNDKAFLVEGARDVIVT